MAEIIRRVVYWPQFKILTQALLAVLIAYVSLMPFYYFQVQSLTLSLVFSLVKYAPFLLACGVLALRAVAWSAGSRYMASTGVGRWMLLYLALSLLSLWGATYARVGLVKWIYYNATGLLLCWLVVQSCPRWEDVRRGVLFLAFISGVVAVYIIFFALSGLEPFWETFQRVHNPYHTRQRAMGPFGSTVATATYAMLLLPAVLWAAVQARHLLAKTSWSLACALLPLAVLLTQTRATQVCILLYGLLLTPWLIKLRGTVRRPLYGLLAALVLAGVVLVQRAPGSDMYAEIRQRWSEILEPRVVTIRDGGKTYRYDSLIEYTERFRIAQYYTVGNILSAHPLTGVGFGTFTREFERFRYAENYMIREFSEHTTENMYLMFLAETGALGLLARLTLMVAIFAVIFGAWRRTRPGSRRDLLWAYLASHVVLAVHMLTWDIFNEPTLRMVYWLWTGLALGAAQLEGDSGVAVVEIADDAA